MPISQYHRLISVMFLTSSDQICSQGTDSEMKFCSFWCQQISESVSACRVAGYLLATAGSDQRVCEADAFGKVTWMFRSSQTLLTAEHYLCEGGSFNPPAENNPLLHPFNSISHGLFMLNRNCFCILQEYE